MINWKWFIVEGILLILLGIFAIARPGIAAEAIVELFGWLLIFLGVFFFEFGRAGGRAGGRSPAERYFCSYSAIQYIHFKCPF